MSKEFHDHVFTVGGGHRIDDGKSCYPNHLSVRLRRQEALIFAMDILSSLQQAPFFTPDAEFLPEIVIPGKLENARADGQLVSEAEITAA